MWFSRFTKRKRNQSKSQAVAVTKIEDLISTNNTVDDDILEDDKGNVFSISTKGVWKKEIPSGVGVSVSGTSLIINT